MHEIGKVGKEKHLSMACALSTKCAKNLYKRTVLVQLIIKNVVTCFFEHSVDIVIFALGCLTDFWDPDISPGHSPSRTIPPSFYMVWDISPFHHSTIYSIKRSTVNMYKIDRVRSVRVRRTG